MIRSKLTTKAQTTAPKRVREALRLRPGDELAYEIANDRVILTKATAGVEDPFATFEEWNSDADRRAMASLEPGDAQKLRTLAPALMALVRARVLATVA